MPVALQALQAAPYILGPPFMELLDAVGHQAKVDGALRDPPTTDEQVFDPRAFLSGNKPLDVDEPPLPDGITDDKKVDSGDFGATSWFFVLAERIDPLVALRAVDGWGGDAYVAYDKGGSTCIRLNWRGDTSTDDQEMHDALDQWAAAMPSGATSVTANGDVLFVESCDLGPSGGSRSTTARWTRSRSRALARSSCSTRCRTVGSSPTRRSISATAWCTR